MSDDMDEYKYLLQSVDVELPDGTRTTQPSPNMQALEGLNYGDPTPLVKLLKSGESMHPYVQELLAEVLDPLGLSMLYARLVQRTSGNKPDRGEIAIKLLRLGLNIRDELQRQSAATGKMNVKFAMLNVERECWKRGEKVSERTLERAWAVIRDVEG